MTQNESTIVSSAPEIRVKRTTALVRFLKRDWQLLVILLPGLIFYILFRYVPMAGLFIAFKKFSPFLGLWESPWVGFENFQRLFTSGEFSVLFRNTLLIGLFNLLWSFPITVVFSLMLNEVRQKFFKKTFQTISYLPSFLSVVVVASITLDVISLGGPINSILTFLGRDKIHFIVQPSWFRDIFIASGIWQTTGSSAIIFLAALSSVDATLYEAASIDGASRMKMIRYITIPAILPTIMTMFILASANVFRVGQDKILLLYNPMTREVADVFSSFVYRRGVLEMNYGYAAAVGMFESIVAGLILWSTNQISKRTTKSSLF